MNGKSKQRGHGEGTITHRSDGRWVAAVSLGWTTGPDGKSKRKRKYLYGATRREVAEKLKVVLREQQQGLPVATERQTMAQFLDKWLADVVKPSVRPKTYASYAQIVRIHLTPALGRHQLSKLTPDQVQSMMNDKLASGLSPRTVQYIRAVLRQALNQALRWGVVARNVATLVDPPKTRRHDIAFLTPDQARSFLATVRGDRLEALYTVAVALGIRQGESLGLRWQDVDFDAGTLTVRYALQRVDGALRLVEPKSAESRRTVVMPTSVAAALMAHRDRLSFEKAAAGPRWVDSGLVFTTPKGTPLDARNVTRHFKARLADAGLPDMRWHDLRHTCASLLLAQGVPARTVMEVLGHSQISLTMNTYAHVMPEMKRDAAAAIDRLLTANG